MMDIQDSVEETKTYKEHLGELNRNIGRLNNTYTALNTVYGGVISAMANVKQG